MHRRNCNVMRYHASTCWTIESFFHKPQVWLGFYSSIISTQAGHLLRIWLETERKGYKPAPQHLNMRLLNWAWTLLQHLLKQSETSTLQFLHFTLRWLLLKNTIDNPVHYISTWLDYYMTSSLCNSWHISIKSLAIYRGWLSFMTLWDFQKVDTDKTLLLSPKSIKLSSCWPLCAPP